MEAASFSAVRQLYSEKTSLVKADYRLNAKAVNPTSLERQNVRLVLDVAVNPLVSNALRTHGSTFKIAQAESPLFSLTLSSHGDE